MSKVIAYVEIIFENLDSIVIPARYFRDFELDDIHTVVRRAAANAILKYSVVNSVMFELEAETNNDAVTFTGDVHCINTGEGTLFDRLQVSDITQLKLIYTDKTEEDFVVVWEDEENNEYDNRLQHTAIDPAGQIRVQIIHRNE